jgi:hypothetical protein
MLGLKQIIVGGGEIGSALLPTWASTRGWRPSRELFMLGETAPPSVDPANTELECPPQANSISGELASGGGGRG